MACCGLYVPAVHQLLVRIVQGRPRRVITWALLAWLATDYAAQGLRALLRIWDKASWHVSVAGQEWIKVHNRHAKHAGGCRVMVCRVSRQSPWFPPSEPKGVHGKRAVVEPPRMISMGELL
jgi:hypothetical protein